jgi:cytochrome c-type biogenesis protein
MFGIDLFDASLLPAMLVALTAGALSFLSPCVLPIVPPYLAYMGGITLDEVGDESRARRGRRRCWRRCSSCWACRRCSSSSASPRRSSGSSFLQNQILSGAGRGGGHHRLRAAFPRRHQHPDPEPGGAARCGRPGGIGLGAYILGLAFAFGWTPCIGPQLGAILSLAATEASVQRGTTLLGVYAIGLGIPFLLAAALSTGPWR